MRYSFKKIGERIMKERKARGISQENICEDIHCSRNTLSSCENGNKILPLDCLLELCEKFECELGFLLCEYDEPTHKLTDLATETGLSRKAVLSLLALNKGTKPLFGEQKTKELKTFEKLLESPYFTKLIESITDYKQNKSDFTLFQLQRKFVQFIDDIQ